MPLFSDANGFPESGFPVLTNESDKLVLNTLYAVPQRYLNYTMDVVGDNRLSGALVINGSLSGVSSLSMGGALSGVTTIAASGTATLSSATAPLTLSGETAVFSMTGTDAVFSMSGARASMGTQFQRINKAWLKDLDLVNRPTVGEDVVALLGDFRNYNSSQWVTSGSDIYYTGGNVGIGTTSPALQTHILSTAASSNPATSGTIQTGGILRLGNSDTNAILDIGVNGEYCAWLQVTNKSDLSLKYPLLLNPIGGNVGIGTTSPISKLHIVGSSVPNFDKDDYSTAIIEDMDSRLELVASDSGSNAASFILNTVAGPNDNRKWFFGAGTSADSNKLHIGYSTSLTDVNPAASSMFVMTTGGNVGIGTTTPGYNLDVNGTGNFATSLKVGTLSGLIKGTGGVLSAITGTQGDIIYYNGTNWVTLAAGTSGYYLKTQGVGANPVWAASTASPGGSDTYVQFNDGGAFEGTSYFSIGDYLDSYDVMHIKNSGGINFYGTTGGTIAGIMLRSISTAGKLGIGLYSSGDVIEIDQDTIRLLPRTSVKLCDTASVTELYLGTSSTKIGVFGATPMVKTSVTDPSAVVTTETADATYSTNEVTMLNNLKSDVTNLQSKLTTLINALQSYGLI